MSELSLQGRPSKQNLLGQKFGKLLVVAQKGRRGASWLCRCDCGKERTFYSSDLIKGHNITCKCGAGKQTMTHGLIVGDRRHRFYRIWDGMRKRCRVPTDENFSRYGGRGIQLLWADVNEFKRDMFDTYIEHVALHGEYQTSIERKDNDGPYSKDNCRWATRKEQGNNRRTNILVRTGELVETLTQFAERNNLDRMYLYRQMHSKV